ncbi:hypothetical protein BU24DRAFT_407741 [Aaosphaeria arxii CBS 175.79]|uniref:Uncharacterized protein n=1 Tax=Aaosphaeria arxii CBS 175.79 TaxID=1450172 RepID=A0A6A5XXS0_9PLEO|nr:uncharacterized protein BU24DRAFT_407741 [Aaosphaeria arxii CBS 175.79]KAF2017756.1 hypothetical protein BU24DRAFT_407741 [Aaosphaeria arxii CBS 175.79]
MTRFRSPIAVLSVCAALSYGTSADDNLIIDKSSCKGLQPAALNSTTRALSNSFQLGIETSTYIHTGLSADGDKGAVTQSFWVDTSDKDLFSTDLEGTDGCFLMFYDLNEEWYEKLEEQEFECLTTLAPSGCLAALRSMSNPPKEWKGEGRAPCSEFYKDVEIPNACPSLKNAKFEIISTNNHTKDADTSSCHTDSNTSGSRSTFVSLTRPADDSKRRFENYDAMAKEAYFFLETFYQVPNVTDGGAVNYSAGYTVASTASCWINNNFTQGSRVPGTPVEEDPKNPEGTARPGHGSGGQNGAGVVGASSLAWAVVVAGYLLAL